MEGRPIPLPKRQIERELKAHLFGPLEIDDLTDPDVGRDEVGKTRRHDRT